MQRRTAIARVRAFNRFYTRILGLLGRRFLDSRYSLTETRVLYEIARGGLCTATGIRAETGIDPGYLSRILDSFRRRGLVSRTTGGGDGRYRLLRLTPTGTAVFARLNAAQDRSIEALVRGLSRRECEELVGHMEGIKKLLGRR
jgi:DNA-binding MarR family transcriptional regulator